MALLPSSPLPINDFRDLEEKAALLPVTLPCKRGTLSASSSGLGWVGCFGGWFFTKKNLKGFSVPSFPGDQMQFFTYDGKNLETFSG